MSGWAAAAQVAGNIFDTWYSGDLARSQQDDAQQFSMQATTAQDQWLERMRGSQYQTAVGDLQAANLNPMLAYMHGGAGTPTVGPASAGTVGTGGGHMGQSVASAFGVDSQIKVNDALADKTKAEADEVRARTPTYAVNIELTKQQALRTTAEIQKVIADTGLATASAGAQTQSTENMRAMLPQIEETVKNLKALTILHGAQADQAFKASNLSQAQWQEAQQRITQNLPQLEANLAKIKAQIEAGNIPQAESKAGVYRLGGGHQGDLLEFLRALKNSISPLTGN